MIYKEGKTIVLPQDARRVPGRQNVYISEAQKKVYYIKRVRGGWKVESEKLSRCCQ